MHRKIYLKTILGLFSFYLQKTLKIEFHISVYEYNNTNA